MGVGVLMFVMGLACLIGPNVVPYPMPLLGKLILAVMGAILMVGGVIVVIVTKLYVKTSADVALVRTGRGGQRVVIDGGIIYIPLIHRTIEVNLRTMKLEVKRVGAQALITGDMMRADVEAEFYVQIEKTVEGVSNAAISFGNRTGDENAVRDMVEERLAHVLRSEAAKTKLVDLNTEREQFTKMVHDALAQDLIQHGLRLVSMAISRLDQAPLDPNATPSNVFDAQGTQSAQVIISAARVVANEAVRNADLAVATKNRETRQQVAQQELQIAQADQGLRWESEQAKIKADESIGRREAEKTQTVRVAQATADREAQVADQQREQMVAVAARAKDSAIAEAEKARSLAQAEQQKAEQERAAQKQGVLTVEAEATAEREKTVQVIAAQQAADVKQTAENREADIQAYGLAKVAAGELEAAKQEAEARRIRALAEQDALTAEAAGRSAIAIVPVNVKAREVEVDARRVETVDRPSVAVLQSRLEAQDAHTQVSVELEKFRILCEATRDAAIAQANAVGQALSAAEMKLFGSPEMLAAYASKFGMGVGLNALLESALGGDGQAALGQVLGAAAGKVAGFLSPDTAAEAVKLVGRLAKMAKDNPQLERLIAELQGALAGQPAGEAAAE